MSSIAAHIKFLSSILIKIKNNNCGLSNILNSLPSFEKL
jgi:hypothetical protein